MWPPVAEERGEIGVGTKSRLNQRWSLDDIEQVLKRTQGKIEEAIVCNHPRNPSCRVNPVWLK